MRFPKKTQHPRLSIGHGRKLQKKLDQGKEYGTMLTDLFKACGCLSHDLIAVKLHAYDFFLEPLKLINSYLTDRKQRVKINDQFNSWMITVLP